MKGSVLIFGAGDLQSSMIQQCRDSGLFTIVIDPDKNAVHRNSGDCFYCISGSDFEGTLEVARKHNVRGLITAASDKPLVMMAKVAAILELPFYSENTAVLSTDKSLMKQIFMEHLIPCAAGFQISGFEDCAGIKYPVIIKPRDNSGSRGVVFCASAEELSWCISAAKLQTRKDTIIVEEYIPGKEYSVESVHFDNRNIILQITEKITNDFPFNVELGHIEPALISLKEKEKINDIIGKISEAFGFENCVSHTELKINSQGIFVIETSPRLGGDYITSHLVPLSTGINMEKVLIQLSIGEKYELPVRTDQVFSGIKYFVLTLGKVISINRELVSTIGQLDGVHLFQFNLEEGAIIKPIKSSVERYGFVIAIASDRDKLIKILSEAQLILEKSIIIKNTE